MNVYRTHRNGQRTLLTGNKAKAGMAIILIMAPILMVFGFIMALLPLAAIVAVVVGIIMGFTSGWTFLPIALIVFGILVLAGTRVRIN
jgi:ABC-type microcin C transport system permease subunit YejE